MKKIIALLKGQAAATALTLVLTVVAILAADVLYRPKEVTKRGFEIVLSADGKPVAKKEEKPVDLATMMKKRQ